MLLHRSLAALAALALTACGGGASDEEVQRAVDDALASRSAAPAASPEPEPEAEPSPTPVLLDVAMPDFVGANLQDAQDAVQELGVFLSVSHDLRGSRNQVLDSGWQVCDQTPAPGSRLQGPAEQFEGKIDFGVVKIAETCP